MSFQMIAVIQELFISFKASSLNFFRQSGSSPNDSCDMDDCCKNVLLHDFFELLGSKPDPFILRIYFDVQLSVSNHNSLYEC